MSFNEIAYLGLRGLNLNTRNLTFRNSLRENGFAIIHNQMANEKADKVMLALFDAFVENPMPNVLICCPQYLMSSWYSRLLMQFGIEFKYTRLSENTIMFFSPEISNLYIMCDEEDENLSVSGEDGYPDDFVWDLMVVDVPINTEGMNTDYYNKIITSKAKKLVVAAPVLFSPNGENEDEKGLVDFIERHLYFSEQGKKVSGLLSGKPVLGIDTGGCVALNTKQKPDFHVETLSYKIPPEKTSPSRRIDSLGTGALSYQYGGNVFEEYSLEERKIYLKKQYIAEDVEVLRQVDTKLSKFLDVLDVSLARGECTVVYFMSHRTMRYVYKVLCALYPRKINRIQFSGDTLELSDYVKQFFSGGYSSDMDIVLTMDNCSERFMSVEKIDHIFNYEYPRNPAVFNKRYFRQGRQANMHTLFYTFVDEDMRFDGRVLQNMLLRNYPKAFRKRIPICNVMSHIAGVENYLAELVKKLKYIRDYTGEVGESFDVVSRLRMDYNISNAGSITTASAAHDYAAAQLEQLGRLFGIEQMLSERELDTEQLHRKISDVLHQMRKNLAYYDDDNRLQFVEWGAGEVLWGNLDNDFVNGADNAHDIVEELFADADGNYVYLRDQLNGLNDVLKTVTLHSIWLYMKQVKGYKYSYSEFLKLYNTGVI